MFTGLDTAMSFFDASAAGDIAGLKMVMCDTGNKALVAKCYTETAATYNNLYIDMSGLTEPVTVIVPVKTSSGAISNVVEVRGLTDIAKRREFFSRDFIGK